MFSFILHVLHEIFCDVFLVSALELQVHIYFLVSCLFCDQLVFVFSIVTFYIFLCLQQKKEALVAFIYASHHCPYSFHFLLTVRNISLAFTFLRPHFYHHIKCGLCPLNSFLFILVDEPKILGAITFSSSFTQNRRLSIVNTCLFSILV